MIFKIITIYFIFSLNCYAEKHEYFTGIAKIEGKIVYEEKHDVTLDKSGNVIEASTVYSDLKGTTLGTLKSDFRKSLSLPEHIFIDTRTQGKYGIRRLADNKIEMFNQDFNKSEQTKLLTDTDDLSRVLIGCQGFNYFLKDEIDNLKRIKTLPVLFMIPGDLSTYKFILELIEENSEQILYFKVKIENWFLRAFAPELEFKYDRKIHHIIWYKGISNIKNDSGKNQKVEIDYKF